MAQVLFHPNIVKEDGSYDEELEPALTKHQLRKMYNDMVYARLLDRWIMRLQRMGKAALHAPCEGQEASQVGSAHALSPEDWVFPSYREHAVYIARGVPLIELMNRQMANSQDVLKGHEFAIYGNLKYRIVPSPIPVGTQIPPAVGFALASKFKKEKIAVMVYFGDGATSKGDFNEGINFAGVFKTPNVFFCQNNQWAISVPRFKQTAARSIADKASAFGIDGIQVDGNDVLAVYKVTREALGKARAYEGPTLIEALTYRIGPHTTADDPKRYRSEEEIEYWRKKDPIDRFRKYLKKKGLWDDEEDKKLWEKADEEIRNAIVEAEKVGELDPEVIFEDVYAEMPWHLKEEIEDVKAWKGREVEID